MDFKNPQVFQIPAMQGLAVQAHLFESSERKLAASFFHSLLATAIFRCWHILLFFGAWSTGVALISHNVKDLSIEATLITVLGTVLGFVISYRTTSSFERYNEGRRYWSQIILASRTFARTVWFNIPDTYTPSATDSSAKRTPEEIKARVIMEKKTTINLVQAFAVAVKHYLRGEDGIHYQDLYHLVKFLPAYALPAGMPSPTTADQMNTNLSHSSLHRVGGSGRSPSIENGIGKPPSQRVRLGSSATSLPQPVTSPRKTSFFPTLSVSKEKPTTPTSNEEVILMPSHMPPQYHLLDFFPFSLMVKALTHKGKELKGKKAARLRARLRNQEGQGITHNVPLEISLYLSSYVAAVQARKCSDVPTMNSLIASLNQLVDALTGLERILTTPIPFSYSFHLWAVATIYNLALPFQLWTPLGWVSIPATVACAFIFFGFLVAGEEIENPFGYDKNDLNMDHFTHAIIRNELLAITSAPPPDPGVWAFHPANDLAMCALSEEFEKVTPDDWVRRGTGPMMYQLST